MTAVAAIDIDQGFQQAWNTVTGMVPGIILFVGILLAGFVVANLLSVATVRLLRRTGFERAVDRGGIRRVLEQSRFDATELLGRVVLYGVLLFTLQLAFGIFGDNPVSDLLASVVAYLPKLFVAIVIVVIAAAIASAVRELVLAGLSSTSYGNALATAAAATIIAIGAFGALAQLEVAPAIVLGLFYALLAVVAGSAIVAIGGGGIQPMRSRWERALSRMEAEAPQVRDGVKSAMEERSVDLVAEEERARFESETARAAAEAEEHRRVYAGGTPAGTETTPGDTTQELQAPTPPPPPTPDR